MDQAVQTHGFRQMNKKLHEQSWGVRATPGGEEETLSQATQDCCRLDGKAFLTQEVDGGTVPGGGEAWPGSGLWMPGGAAMGSPRPKVGSALLVSEGCAGAKGPWLPLPPGPTFTSVASFYHWHVN